MSWPDTQFYDATVHEEEKQDRDNARNERPGRLHWLAILGMGHVHNTAVASGKQAGQDTFAAKRSKMNTSSKGTNAILVIVRLILLRNDNVIPE